MGILIVVENPDRWPLDIPAAEVVAARRYLTEPEAFETANTVVINLCRSYGYQKVGYYVSLLAEARGHRPQPSVATLQDLREPSLARTLAAPIDEAATRSLGTIRADTFELSVYFGRNTAERHRRLAQAIFNVFRAPLLRARFRRTDEHWELHGVRLLGASDIPERHKAFVVSAAERYFADRRWSPRVRRRPRGHLAILVDPDETAVPSDERALRRFEAAAQRQGLATERIGRHDYARVAEFDALFIRTTTAVNHYTYRFARRAAAEGLVVMDDPQSIIRATNKVFLAELLRRVGVRQPRTLVVDQESRGRIAEEIGFPCVLKVPDSAFSKGVLKAADAAELDTILDRVFEDTELLVAQEFLPTRYDWRVGVLDRQVLYVCRYYMAPKHWQIIKHEDDVMTDFGRSETLAPEDAPPTVLRAALRAANAIGDGLYGVDLKQSGRHCYVIEVNDNPNIDAGLEDKVLGRALYDRIIGVFLERIEARRRGDR